MHKHTKKQKLYFDKVIKLHYEKGYGEDRISRIIPIGHATVSRWLAIFASENDLKSVQMQKRKLQSQRMPADSQSRDVESLQREVIRLQSELRHERLRSEAFDEMINVAESKFNIAIRKKVGAKR
jgi:transposase